MRVFIGTVHWLRAWAIDHPDERLDVAAIMRGRDRENRFVGFEPERFVGLRPDEVVVDWYGLGRLPAAKADAIEAEIRILELRKPSRP